MIEVDQLKVDKDTVLGLKIDLPNSPPLIALIGDQGFIMCGFLSMDAADELGVTAAVVSGVESFDDVLNGEVKAVTAKAEERGVRCGMKGREAMRYLL